MLPDCNIIKWYFKLSNELSLSLRDNCFCARLIIWRYCSLTGPNSRSGNDGVADLAQKYTRDTPRSAQHTVHNRAHFKMQQTLLANSMWEGKCKGGGGQKKNERETDKNIRCLGFVFSLPSPFLQPSPFCSSNVHAHQTRLQQQSPVLYEQRTGRHWSAEQGGEGAPLFRGMTAREVASGHRSTRVPPASLWGSPSGVVRPHGRWPIAHPDRTASLA